MSDEQQEQEHPLIQRFKSVVPHLIESGLFSELVLSTFNTRVTNRLIAVHVFGTYRDEPPSRRGPSTAHIDFEAIGEMIGTDLLPYVPDSDIDMREAAVLSGMTLLLT